MIKKLRLPMLIVLGMCSVIGAATFAWYMDSATNGPQTLTAGTVSIDSFRDGFDVIPGPMFYTTPEQGEAPDGTDGLKATGPWQPGDTHVRSLVVYNDGSLDATLDQVKAEIRSDEVNLRSQLNVEIYNIAPTYFTALGDDTLDEQTLEATREGFNEYVTQCEAENRTPLSDGLSQQVIESQSILAKRVWSGKLSELVGSEQHFTDNNNNLVGINLNKVRQLSVMKNGVLLAFKVQLDGDSTGNDYQSAQAVFDFKVIAHQKNNYHN